MTIYQFHTFPDKEYGVNFYAYKIGKDHLSLKHVVSYLLLPFSIIGGNGKRKIFVKKSRINYD